MDLLLLLAAGDKIAVSLSGCMWLYVWPEGVRGQSLLPLGAHSSFHVLIIQTALSKLAHGSTMCLYIIS